MLGRRRSLHCSWKLHWKFFEAGFGVTEVVWMWVLQHMTYQYAKRGARLVLVARREAQLTAVADRAVKKGASDVKVIVGDVTKEEECKRFIDETIAKFGQCKFVPAFC